MVILSDISAIICFMGLNFVLCTSSIDNTMLHFDILQLHIFHASRAAQT